MAFAIRSLTLPAGLKYSSLTSTVASKPNSFSILTTSTRGVFPINPKVYNGENVSCKYCDYKDICFMKDKDITYLEKVENLDFLGGEE